MPFNLNSAVKLSTAHTNQHFQSILKLQQHNQRDALTIEQQAKQGFLYARYNEDILQKLATCEAQVIAVDGDKLAGYNLCIATALVSELPSLRSMFYAFDHTQYRGRLLSEYTYVVGGQVCVDQAYRGQGLLKRMYNEMKRLTNHRYQLCVTDVAQRNTISLNAHLKAGFVIAGSYPHDGETWHTVVCDWRENIS